MRTFHKFGAVVVIVIEFIRKSTIKTTQCFFLLCSEKVQRACLLVTWSIKSVSHADQIPEPLEKYTTIAEWLMFLSSARLFFNPVLKTFCAMNVGSQQKHL